MFCYNGTWALVWKHSYFQVDTTKLALMRTDSKYYKPCLDLSDGWCNIPNKQPPGYTEQLVAGFHNGTLVFAYKSVLNPKLGIDYTGPYLKTTEKVVDKCLWHNGVRPSVSTAGPVGLGFDKVRLIMHFFATNNCNDFVH